MSKKHSTLENSSDNKNHQQQNPIQDLNSMLCEVSLGKTMGENYMTSSHSLGLSLESSVTRQFSDFPVSLSNTSQNVSTILSNKPRSKKRLEMKFFNKEFDR